MRVHSGGRLLLVVAVVLAPLAAKAQKFQEPTKEELPSGYAVESAPQPAQLPWPDHAALVVKTRPGSVVIDIKHIFARAFVLLDPKEYPTLRDYYQKIATSDQQQVVLTQAATGN